MKKKDTKNNHKTNRRKTRQTLKKITIEGSIDNEEKENRIPNSI